MLNQRYSKTGLSYDIDFLHMGRHPQQPRIDSSISNSLTGIPKHVSCTLTF